MASTFDTRVAAGLARLHARTQTAATYRRDAVELEVLVTWGKTGVETMNADGAGIIHEFTDALIEDYADLISTFGVPRRGDEIEQNGIVRQVLPAGDEHVYRYSGNNRQVLRIHTKIVEES